VQNATSFPWAEAFSIIASIVSLVLGGFAIWLSIVFYRLSNESSAKIKESADRIAASVDRLEALFDKLYADTFSMMKDTVSDMRKHIWRDDTVSVNRVTDEAEQRADKKVQQLQEQFQQEVGRLLSRQSSTDARVAQIGDEIKNLVGRAINESRRAETEAREETLRENIVNIIKNSRRGSATLVQIGNRLADKYPGTDIVDELFKMAHEDIVTWHGAPSELSPDNQIRLVQK
jgi:alanyl-tRNA synthetase